MPHALRLSLPGLALMLFPSLAHADAIDGAWCGPEGRRIAIEGPAGVYTGGLKVTGQYTRHSYAFSVPQGASGAGALIEMVLRGETRVMVRIDNGEPQIWQRCSPDIS